MKLGKDHNIWQNVHAGRWESEHVHLFCKWNSALLYVLLIQNAQNNTLRYSAYLYNSVGFIGIFQSSV